MLFGKSFRTNKEKELIQIGKEKTNVEISYSKSDRKGKIQFSIGECKNFYVNEIKVKRLSELLRKFVYCFI